MGFFDLKAECGVCGKTVGMNRYQVKKDNAWCCPDCFKKAQNGANGPRVFFIQNITLMELKTLVNDPYAAVGEVKETVENKEYRMHCNVCGHIYCYTRSDIDINNQRLRQAKREATASAMNAIAGSSYHMYEQRKAMESSLDDIVDFSKCPKCNSKDVKELTEEEFKAIQSRNNTSAAPALSTADELKKFKELLDAGIITQEEFDAKKKQLLGL